MSEEPRYTVILRPLSDDEGGGWLATVPDLPGCMSDGATGEEAFRNALDAIKEWKDEAMALGRTVYRNCTAVGDIPSWAIWPKD